MKKLIALIISILFFGDMLYSYSIPRLSDSGSVEFVLSTQLLHSTSQSQGSSYKVQFKTLKKQIINGKTVVTTSENNTTPPECLSGAISFLQKNYPIGFNIYNNLTDKNIFSYFLDCSLKDYDLELALHESIHMLTNYYIRNNKLYVDFYTSSGQNLTVINKNLFPRSEIVPYLNQKERLTEYAKAYLYGDFGKQDLLVLLDEIHAYTYSLAFDASFPEFFKNQQKSSRDGLVVMMQYLELYLKRARIYHALDYQKIYKDPAYLNLIQKLRSDAESILRVSMPNKNLGINDVPVTKKIYEPKNIAELQILFKKGNRDFVYDKAVLSLISD